MPRLRSAVVWLLFVTATALAMAMLDQLARLQLRQHLQATASAVLGALSHGDTPHRWSASVANDIIAGRPFGSDDSAFVGNGLRVRSHGDSIQIGFVLDTDIDLLLFPDLDIDLDSERAGTLSLIIGSSLESTPCQSSPAPLPPGDSSLTLDLRRLAWRCAGEASTVPTRAAMLRIQLDLPANSSATLHTVRAQPATRLTPESLASLSAPLLPSPRQTVEFHRALDRAASDTRRMAWPILQLPLDGRVEQSLLARDQIRAAIPDALIVQRGSLAAIAAGAQSWKPAKPVVAPSKLAWLLLAGYVAALLMLRLKPPLDPRLRALLELLATIVVPISLVVGGWIGDNISPPVLGASAATLVFALSLLIGGAPAQPTARTLKRGWWVALASLALCVALILELGNGHISLEMPPLARIGRYLVWAALQQFLVCVIISERIERLSGSPRLAMLGAALIFALLHTPNGMLMQLSFVAGLIWIWNWQLHRALLANIVAHAASGLLLATSMPPQWLHSAEVSARFFL